MSGPGISTTMRPLPSSTSSGSWVVIDPALLDICQRMKGADLWEEMQARCAELNAQSDADVPIERYVRLWRAALGEAVTEYHKGAAGIYTFVGTKEFDELCERALLEPDYVRRKLREHRRSENWDKPIETIEREWQVKNGLANA
jgi:hypothetical protein